MASLDIDNNEDAGEYDDDDDERVPLNAQPLDERILDIIRNTKKDEKDGHRTIRPASLVSELGLSIEEANRELCGLLSAVGGGLDGASFVFERVEMPTQVAAAADAATTTTTTMVFTFPHDYAQRAKRYRRQTDMKQQLKTLYIGLIKGIKVFTAFGLIISLAVLIIAGICLMIAALIALARGGHNGNSGHRNHPLMHRLRYLFFQLRQILWLYAICGSAIDGNQDPFMREVAGDLAFMMSIFCGNPMHPFFWFRVGGMRRRWARVRNRRGWSGGGDTGIVGVTMTRRGTWADDNSQSNRSVAQAGDQQRGLLSIAVEYLFGPTGGENDADLEKARFRAAILLTLSTTTEGGGVSLRELLPFLDNPPASAHDASAIHESLKIVTYFNGKPVDISSSGEGIDAKFCFPEIVSEMVDCSKLLTLASSKFAPPASNSGSNITSILYKEDGYDFGSSDNASSVVPEYLYEQPVVLTELSRPQFGQCVILGLLNFIGVIWIQSAMSPGGLLELVLPQSGSKTLVGVASILLIKLMTILRFYSKIFLALPLCRFAIVLIRNFFVNKRNKRRLNFIRTEL